ncbi:MAG: helix-turn-helix domain-containing protein [Fusobacteriaceae bacterium]
MGFFKVDNRVIDTLKFDDGTEGFVFVILGRFCNNGQTGYPTIEYLMKVCNCSKSKMIKVIKNLEKKEYIVVARRHMWSNRYSINPACLPETPQGISETPQGVFEIPNKEQHINNNIKESLTRRDIISEIQKIIVTATGINLFRVEQSFKGTGKTVEKLEEILGAIKSSDFLLGRKVKKPDIWHYNQTDNILNGLYSNRDGKSEPVPGYYSEFPKTGVIYYEPID